MSRSAVLVHSEYTESIKHTSESSQRHATNGSRTNMKFSHTRVKRMKSMKIFTQIERWAALRASIFHSYNGHSDVRQTVVYNLDHSDGYIGGSGRRHVGHSILMSIHRCKHPVWKKWSHGVTWPNELPTNNVSNPNAAASSASDSYP
jgi:hypothetical protein